MWKILGTLVVKVLNTLEVKVLNTLEVKILGTWVMMVVCGIITYAVTTLVLIGLGLINYPNLRYDRHLELLIWGTDFRRFPGPGNGCRVPYSYGATDGRAA